MGASFSTNQFQVDGRTVLITGGSRGMGLEVGRQSAAKGANVVIVARDRAKLRESIDSISKSAVSPSQRFLQISADVTDASEAVRIIAETTKWNNDSPPDIVWCCAGSPHPALFIDTPISKFNEMLSSNYCSALYTAHATLRAWLPSASDTVSTHSTSDSKDDAKDLKPRSGPESARQASFPTRHIIFVGSFLSFYTFTGYSAYSPTKAALRSLSDSLSQEMNLYAAAHPAQPRVRVHTAFPASIFTESYEAENKIKPGITKLLEGDDGQTPGAVARRCIEALERGEELVCSDFLTRFAMTGMLSGSTRGGFWKGLVDWTLSLVVGIVFLFVRWDMDKKVSDWGRTWGSSGMKDARN